MSVYKVCIFESRGKISNTIVFGDGDGGDDETVSDFRLLPDDSIRTIKMKILYELNKTLHISVAYEEVYIYAYVSENTSTLKLFSVLKSETGEDDPFIPISTISQMLQGHPKSDKILLKLGKDQEPDQVKYSELENVLSEKQLSISVKTPIGFKNARGGQRDATFEVDPFYARTQFEHPDMFSSDNTLLFNYGEIADNTLYVCLADRVLDSDDYISRYYYPGLYSASIKDHNDLLSRRPKLIKQTIDLINESREHHYKSIQTFYDIAADKKTQVDYKSRGVVSATIRIKNEASRSINLELIFKNVHARRETPYIKFNPANRRENLYRFFFVRTTRTGKKIPLLSRSKIMRLSKETGKSQQISIYLEEVVLKESAFVSNSYLHFESNGDIQLQFSFSKPVDDKTIDGIIVRSVIPLLKIIGKDLKQTGYIIPIPPEDGAIFRHSRIVDMEFVAVSDARKPISWETVPCLYSICTLHDNQVRLKRVENFQDMDAARILILELYGKIQYGDYSLQNIVDELISRKFADSKEAAGALVSEVLGSMNEVDGVILEQPGFPIGMKIDNEEHTVELRISGLTSASYIDTVSVYFDAILKTTQYYNTKSHLLAKLNKYCKKSKKFEEKVKPQESRPVSAPLRFNALMAPNQDLFAQFASDDEESGDIIKSLKPADDDSDSDVEFLLEKLQNNVREIQPVNFGDDSEDEDKQEPIKKVNVPVVFEDDDEKEEVRSIPDAKGEIQSNSGEQSSQEFKLPQNSSTKFINILPSEGQTILQFHSKSTDLTNKELLADGMPTDAMKRLSNFSEHSVEFKGRVFPTVEHAFQSQKYEVSGHKNLVSDFTVDGKGWTAVEAETQGGKGAMKKLNIELNIERWNKESFSIMEELIQSKIERHPDIRNILEIIKRHNIYLAHFSKSDDTWGCHVKINEDPVIKGNNLLGKIFMNAILYLVSEKPKGPIAFDDEDELEDADYYGGKNTPEEDTDDDEAGIVPDGMPLKPVNPFLKKLRKKDPVLFARKAQGKFKAFSVSCQPTSRHPVILTDSEFKNTDPSSYKHSIKYGSDPKNQHHFICPRFWCFLTNSAISEKDAMLGKCGEIIPKGANKIPKGAYVYELNDRDQYPGFIEDSREDGKCLPCCFKTWDGKTQTDARAKCAAQMNDEHEPVAEKKQPTKKKITQKTAQYIYNLDTYPVPHQRWGFLPISVQLFLNMDYRPVIDPNNPALLQNDKPVLLRCGVEQPFNQSFLGNFAIIYAKRHSLEKTPTVEAFKQTLANAITLDDFVKAHNGSLLSAFSKLDSAKKPNRKKYENTEFAIGLDLTDKSQKRYFDDSIVAYENFLEYLNDPTGIIDHQYLWDFVCDDNARIIPGGLNLVILEIRANDMLDRVELLCPTNLYSNNQFSLTKDTVILLKHDQYYEPIFQYESTATSPIVEAFFRSGKVSQSILSVLKNVELSTKKYCPALPSLPSVYGFLNPVSMRRMLESMTRIEATIDAQVLNYQGKTIGLVVVEKDEKRKKTGVYIPCAPSARLKDVPVKYMDDLSLPKDYKTTTAALIRISAKAKIPCRPVWKISEDGMIVGFLTETNQFVPIKPNQDVIMDDLRTYEGVDAFAADKTIATNRREDKKRVKMNKYILLETQFYHAFRNRVRTLINAFSSRAVKRDLKQITNDPALLYQQKMKQIEPLITELARGQIVFVDFDKDDLLDMADLNSCEDESDKSPYCFIKENGVAQLAIPKWNLLSKYDNEQIYFGRLIDELVRNDRVKAFMYDTVDKLNAQNVDYNIRNDEFILVQSALTPEYFAELDSTGEHGTKYATNTNYELANPSITKYYPNEKVPLEEQYQEPVEDDGDEGNCVINVGAITGNPKQIWRRIFSQDAREWTYRDTVPCTLQPIIRIVKEHLGKNWDDNKLRRRLSSAYTELLTKNPSFISKVGGIMRKQGKTRIFAKKDMSLEELSDIIISDSYYLSDLDIWVLANKYDLPIILFNTNGLKGFFAKLDITWLKLNGTGKSSRYYFMRSTVGSFPNKIYEYGLIVPAVPLETTKEFAGMVEQSLKDKGTNTTTLEESLSKIIFVANVKR